MSHEILIVDDEASIRKVLATHLRRLGHQVHTANDGAEAIVQLKATEFDLVVSDLRMPSMGGMDLLKWTNQHHPDIPVILITAHGSVHSAVEALKRGAFDYVTKPFDVDELQAIIEKALATRIGNDHHLHERGDGRFDIIGRTAAMAEIYARIEKVAPSPTTVLITGESGTGKELVARALHDNSPRKNAPFVQVNCGAIPEPLFEAELFGFEKDAFTEAHQTKPGRFELANGGTLFLDEVGELPKEMQIKLLRVLHTQTIERVGGTSAIDLDVRVVAATNEDLGESVRQGVFREDLFYRLNVVPIALPPLRARTEDIPLLVDHFVAKFNQRLGRRVTGAAPGALRMLEAWPWPGNIRELENVIERTVLLADQAEISTADLSDLAIPNGAADQEDNLGLKDFVRAHTARLEAERIARVLQIEEGNVTRAARRLGISRKSLQTKMKEYGLRDG